MRPVLSAPSLASDEFQIVGETGGGPIFSGCLSNPGPVPSSAPIVSIVFEGRDVGKVNVAGSLHRICTRHGRH